MKNKFIIFIFIFLLVTSSLTVFAKSYGPYHGQVTDKATGEPVPGAVVVMSVTGYIQIKEYRSQTFIVAVSEAVTNERGEFKVPSHVVNEPYPSVILEKEQIVVYKPGYVHYPGRDSKPVFTPFGTLPKDQFVLIQLPPKPSSLAKRPGSPKFGDEFRCLYVLSQLLDQERIESGYEPYHLDNYWRIKGLISGSEKTISDNLDRWTYMHIRPSTYGVGKGFNPHGPSIAHSKKHPQSDEWYVWYYHPKEHAEFINELERVSASFELGERKSVGVETVNNIPDDAVMFTEDSKEKIDNIVAKIKKKGRLLFLHEEYKDIFVQLLDEGQVPFIIRTVPGFTGYDILWREEYNRKVEVIKAALFGMILGSHNQEKDSERCLKIPEWCNKC